MCDGCPYVSYVGFSLATRASQKPNRAQSFGDKSGMEDSQHCRSSSPMDRERAQHVLAACSVDLRLRRDEVRREHVSNTVQANAQASCDHDRGALLLARVRQCVCVCVQQHRGEECPCGGGPDQRGCVMKSGSKQERPYNATSIVRMVYPEKGGRIVIFLCFSSV